MTDIKLPTPPRNLAEIDDFRKVLEENILTYSSQLRISTERAQMIMSDDERSIMSDDERKFQSAVDSAVRNLSKRIL